MGVSCVYRLHEFQVIDYDWILLIHRQIKNVDSLDKSTIFFLLFVF